MRGIRQVLSMLFLGLALLGLGCKDTVEAPTGLSYSANPASYVVGTAIPANTPTHGGGSIDSYAVSPDLPAGLALDAKSGSITGTPTQATALATYTVTGTNSEGSTTVQLSITVTAAVAPISITTQPASQTGFVGQTATFTVVATGTGTLSYQWRKDGVVIPGATSASYTTPTLTLAENGSTYSVDLANGLGDSLASASATLTVQEPGGPGTFLPAGAMASRRADATATLLAGGKVVLVAGGYDGSSVLGSAELYDPGTDSFSPTGGMAARRFHTATLLADGKVLIVGGSNASLTLATAQIYDPATGTFSATGSLVHARADHTATLLPDGQVLVVGGGDMGTFQATAERYDPATGTFTVTANAPAATRAAHTATLLENGKVLIAGGKTATSLLSAELYDPVAGTFEFTGLMAIPRAFHTATLLPDGQVLVVGGAATAIAERYDPATGTFTATGSLVQGRNAHAAALLPTGKVLICGGLGLGSPAPLLATAELFDPATNTFAVTGNLASGRELHTATALANGKVLVVGGYGGVSFLASAEIYY